MNLLSFKTLRQALISMLMILIFSLSTVAPFMAKGAGLVPCDGPGGSSGVVSGNYAQYDAGYNNNGVECNWQAFIELVSRVENYAFAFGFAVTAIMVAYAGLKMVMDAGSGKAMGEAKSIFLATGKGFIIMLAAWVFVKFILWSLLNDSFKGFIGPYFN